VLKEGKADFKPIYDADLPIKQKIEIIAREIYGADGVDFTATASKNIEQIEAIGYGKMPVCMAKTQYSFSDDATKLGRRASASPSRTLMSRQGPGSWWPSPATS
jgi:formate--tetrahydrofolate ligase